MKLLCRYPDITLDKSFIMTLKTIFFCLDIQKFDLIVTLSK